MAKVTDDTLMATGQYKGVAMINIPASYLIWVYDNDRCSKDVREYITDNLDVLREEISRSNKNKKFN